MFGLFKKAVYDDPHLGRFTRQAGAWRGQIDCGSWRAVPLRLPGSALSPAQDALAAARGLSAVFRDWQATMAADLYDHYEPYAAAVAEGALRPGPMLTLQGPESVWRHAHAEAVTFFRDQGKLVMTLALRVDWDEEHRIGLMIEDGQYRGLNGSVP